MKDYFLPFLIGVALVACMIVTFQIGNARGYQRGYENGLNVPSKADTIWRTDTHFVYKPVEKWKTKEKVVYVPLKVDSLVTVHDTTYVALEREIRGYSGDEYQAQVSGIEPQLDWVKVFPKTMTITERVVEKKKWGFGVSVGPGVYWNGTQVQPGLGAVVGFQYRF